jgi:hypothetical protein
MVDHSGPTSYAGNTSDAAHLAGLGRELAANDPQNRTDSGRGQVGDRNVELLVKAPATWVTPVGASRARSSRPT